MDAKTHDIVAFGEAMIEFNQRDPSRPEFIRGFGGDTSNAAIAAARLGARSAYLSQVGDDEFGRDLLALWQREGVDTAGVRALAGGSTGLYFVSHGPEGHRFSYRRAGSAASLITPADLPRKLIAGARFLHVSGISMAISASACDAVFEAIAVARAAGTRLSLDLNFRPRLAPAPRALALARQALRDAALFFPSVDEVTQLTGLSSPEDIVRWAHDEGARAVALKLGAQGCIVSDGQGLVALPASPVQAVDATGAGDCFAGTCLAQLAHGASLVEAARAANAAAALSTLGYGAVDPLPRREALGALLRPLTR